MTFVVNKELVATADSESNAILAVWSSVVINDSLVTLQLSVDYFGSAHVLRLPGAKDDYGWFIYVWILYVIMYVEERVCTGGIPLVGRAMPRRANP